MEEKDLKHTEHEEGCTCDDCCDDEVVELTGDNGDVHKFYHIGTIDHKDKVYAFFQPAEEMEGVDPEEVVIFEVGEEEGTLLPVENEELLDEVYEAFCDALDEDDCCDDDDDGCGCGCGCGHHHHEE